MSKRQRQPIAPKRKRKPPVVKPGDHVLIGAGCAAYPWEWLEGVVAWCDGHEVLVRCYNDHETWHQLYSVHVVRAVGRDHVRLAAIKQAAAKEVEALQRAVDDAGQALGAARAALWARLEELSTSLKIIPLDEVALAAHDAAERAAMDAFEARTWRPDDPLTRADD